MELAVEEVFREEPTEEEDAPSAIEKPKKPHGNKGRAPTAAQIANLEKGREVRKAMKDERIKEEAKKRPNVAKALKVELAVPSQPDTPPIPPKPKLKRHKQVIVFQSDSESDEEANQIIIKRSKRKPAPKKAEPIQEQEEYYEPEPQFFEPEPRFRLKRV
jgi:hypothetical protein